MPVWFTSLLSLLAVYLTPPYQMQTSSNCLVITSKRMRWAGYIACMGEVRNAYKILAGKLNGKRSLGRTRHRWKDKI
jgi:hypothetical protein